MSESLVRFYNRYHQKNQQYTGVISDNNFTYWYILQSLRQVLPTKKVGQRLLDVGCGVGTLALYAAQYFQEVMGIDISSRAIAIANRARIQLQFNQVRFVKSSLRRFTQPFTCIICTEVIEHIADDSRFMKLLFQNLKSKGWLVLSTPSSDNILTKVGYYRSFDVQVGHVRRYSPAEITLLCREAGFTIQQVRLVEGPLRSILFTSPLGHLIRIIRGPLVPLFHLFDTVSGTLFGYSDIIVVAQKP